MTLLAGILAIVGGLLILSGYEHVPIWGTAQQILSGDFHVKRHAA